MSLPAAPQEGGGGWRSSTRPGLAVPQSERRSGPASASPDVGHQMSPGRAEVLPALVQMSTRTEAPAPGGG